MIGQTILHYRVTERLGAGGMGVVYAAEDLTLRRPVALKFVPEELAQHPQALERLRVEARAASALNHANICTIYAVEEFEHQPFIVMELLKGRTLRERLHEGTPLKVMHIVDIGIQAADALDAAHASGIIHRDIKPANIFINDRGHVKILDFGVAKFKDTTDPLGTRANTLSATAQLTPGGMTLGTVAYMSPEQATGEPLDGRTDLFSLGVVLYETATGRHPFPGKTSALVLSAILNKAPAQPGALNPDLPPRLQEVIANCLEKDPELRYQAAAGLRADLKRVKRDLESGMSGVVPTVSATTSPAVHDTVAPDSHAAVAAPPADPAPSSAAVPTASRRPLAFLAAGVLVAVAAGGAYLFRREPPVPLTAERGLDAPTLTAGTAPAGLDPAALAAAQASLTRRDYRSALAQATDLLRRAPGDEAAAAVWDAARTAIDQLEQALADADRLLAAGDGDGAAAALERARAIDPTSTRLSELSSQLARLRALARTQAPRTAATPPSSRAARDQAEPAPRPAPPPAEPIAPTPPPTATAPPSAPVVATAPPAQPETASAAPPAETRPAAAQPAPPAEPKPSPPAANDDAAIRQVVATYARAIETKDIALFQSVKPNLSAEEERRVVEGFRVVQSQRVNATILAIDRQGARAVVRLRRRDTIASGGRTQTTDSEQTITMARDGDRWVIERIGQ